MSLSDCDRCWDTPCICGYSYRHLSSKDVQGIIDALNVMLVERNSGKLFLNTVQEAISYGVVHNVEYIDKTMDLIYEDIDIRLLDGAFDSVDWILSEVSIELTPIVLLLSFLTITRGAITKLPNRPKFYQRVYYKIIEAEGKAKADRLLQGL